MRINVAVPEAHVERPVLDAALEATTRLNESMLEDGDVPLFRQAVKRVRWKPEPPGEEHFDHAGVVLGRGWGDCDDLAPWHAASLRVTGEDPDAEAIVKRSGNKRWHAVVQRGDGSIDDPSTEAGMPGPGMGTNGIMGAGLPLMMRPESSVVGGTYLVRPQLALRPYRDRAGQIEAWQARGDLPWHWLPGKSPSDVAMVSLHSSPVSSQAIVGACEGLIDLGEANDVEDEVLDLPEAVAAMCDGASWEDLAFEYGPDVADAASNVVGGLFGGLGKIFKSVAKPFGSVIKTALPVAKAALPFVPGVGPIASKALQFASPALQQLMSRGGHRRPARRRVMRRAPTRGAMMLRCVPMG